MITKILKLIFAFNGILKAHHLPNNPKYKPVQVKKGGHSNTAFGNGSLGLNFEENEVKVNLNNLKKGKIKVLDEHFRVSYRILLLLWETFI